MPAVILAADQPPESLCQFGADQAVIIGAAAVCRAAGTVQDCRAGPRNLFHYHTAQAFARHIHPVAQGIGAEQGRARIIAEDIHQCAGVDRIDMLGVKRQSGTGQPVGNPAMNRAHPADRGEQAEHAAARRLDQPGIGARQGRYVAALYVGHDQDFGLIGIIERARSIGQMRGNVDMRRAGPGDRRFPILAVSPPVR